MHLDTETPAAARRPRLGMAVYGDLAYDSRVLREASSLARAGYEVRLACLPGDNDVPGLPDGVSVIVCDPGRGVPDNPYGRPGRGGVAGKAAWLIGYVRRLRAWGRVVVRAVGVVDAWHLHDLSGLAAIGPAVPRSVPVVYDAHEIFVESGTAARLPGPGRRLLGAYERRLARRVVAVVTVNDAIASELANRLGPRRFVVVYNCPELPEAADASAPSVLRAAAGAPESAPLVLYHGMLGPDRGVEQLIAAMTCPGMETAHLVLLGFGDLRHGYAARAADPAWGGRLHVLDPVPSADLVAWIRGADVGGMPIQRSTLNHYLSTPNKLFECLAAGVPVVASDFPVVRRIVLDDPDGPLGAVCDETSPERIAEALASLLALDSDARAVLRARCRAAAEARWNWGAQAERLTALYDGLLGGEATPAGRGAGQL